jgi:hypothetical protein
VDAALLIEAFDGAVYISARELFNDRLQLWITLSHDLVEMSGVDSGFLELVIRSASLDRFMLANVAHEQHAIVWSEPFQKRVHLFRARQARLVEHVQPLLILPVFAALRAPDDVAACSIESMPASASLCAARDVGAKPSTWYPSRSAASRTAVSAVVLPVPALPSQCHDLIPTRQNLVDRYALAGVQVLVLARDRLARMLGHQFRALPLAGAHPLDGLSFELHHRWRGERPSWRASLLLDGDEFASLDAPIELLLDAVEARLGVEEGARRWIRLINRRSVSNRTGVPVLIRRKSGCNGLRR